MLTARAYPSSTRSWTEENLDELSGEQLETLRQRAVPEPSGVIRDTVELTNDARLDIPSTLICTRYSSKQYQEAVDEGYAWLAGLKEVRNITWVDLPTSHGRCGRARRSSPRSSATSRRRTPRAIDPSRA